MVKDTIGKFLFLFFLFFWCFVFVPFDGYPGESRVEVAFPPTYGSPRRQGLGGHF